MMGRLNRDQRAFRIRFAWLMPFRTTIRSADRCGARSQPRLSGCHPQPLAVVFGHAHGRSPVDLEDLRARLREAFGNMASDELSVMMRKLIDALSPFGDLEEATLNAGDGGHEVIAHPYSW